MIRAVQIIIVAVGIVGTGWAVLSMWAAAVRSARRAP